MNMRRPRTRGPPLTTFTPWQGPTHAAAHVSRALSRAIGFERRVSRALSLSKDVS